MNIKNILAALLVVAGLGATTANAAYLDGNELRGWCDASETRYMCGAYIMGVADADAGHIKKDIETGEQCVPAKVTGTQLRSIVEKWLDENPQYLHKAASLLIRNAVIEAFNCFTGDEWVLD